METKATHIIHRLNLQVAVSSEAEARAWLQDSDTSLQSQWLARVEKLLDQYSPVSRHIRLDQVSIQMTCTKREDWMDKALEALKEKLDQLIQKESKATKYSEQEQLLDLFFAYLQQGRLPWYAPKLSGWDSKALIEAIMLAEQSCKQQLLDLLQKNNWTRFRIARQMELPVMQYLASLLLPLKVYKRISPVLGMDAPAWSNFWTHLDARHCTGQQDLVKALEKDLWKELPAEPELQPLEMKQDQEVFVGNAGLVILHPFLQQLFVQSGWVTEQKFIGLPEQEKAVHLLHHLAGAELRDIEVHMEFEKYLCGLPIAYPLPRLKSLSPELQEEAEQLLQAVVKHWTALGNSSPAALQEGLLQRHGKQDESSGKIWVEQSGIDILLEQLPWGIRTIKLPWLPELLQVNW